MPITITLKNGEGAMFPNDNAGANGPVLEGYATFPLSDDKDGDKLRLNVAAWKKDKDGKKFYSLSVGGLNGALFPEDAAKKTSEKSPDYTGTLGANRELRVAAWKRTSTSDNSQFISITIEEKRQSNGNGRDSQDTGFADDRRTSGGKNAKREKSFI